MADRKRPASGTGALPGKNLRDRVEAVRWVYPGYFALVMATGIVSSALQEAGWPGLSGLLLVVAVVSFAVLAAVFTVRVAAFAREVLADLSAPGRAYGFFTFVAACGVVGTRIAADGTPMAAVVLGVIGFVAWAGLSYGVPVRLILGPRTDPVLAGVNGSWFIWVVGSQSLAVVAATVGSAFPGRAGAAGLAAVLMWSVGVVLYLIVATLVLARLLLLEVRPQDLTPPYWIAMGATAITVLAAARILRMPQGAATSAVEPVVTGLAVVFWAFGTWLIPLLAVFTIWQYVLRRVHLEYLPQLWSIVFPLGMYAAAGMALGRVAGLPIIEGIGRAWVWVAFAAWGLVFAAMLAALLRPFLGRMGRSAAVAGRPSDES
ncbi:MAG: tellurite resistance/C4-dicarboxylate transporter family protein [Nocardiopsaceae bacterium]|nr:tellurite resistance/C4-dicarboxylate transporter family protein [Nocardiopsaceae bacterium]